MAYVVTLTGFRPPSRSDGTAWTQARLEESAAEDGTYTTIETFTLSPADTTPAYPQARSFTSEDATLADGWYRIVWLDATADESPPSEAVRVPRPWMPSVDQVAAILFARLGTRGGGTADTFTDATKPTASQVATIIGQQSSLVLMDVGDLSDAAMTCSQVDVVRDAVRTLIAQRAAATIELSYWPEEVVSGGRTAREYWDQIVTQDQARVVQAASECRTGDVVPGSEASSQGPSYSFPGVGDVYRVPGTETFVSPPPLRRRW